MTNVDIDTFENKAPELLTDLAKHVETELVEKHSIEQELARQIGVEIAMRISKAWAGAVVYIPRALLFELSERDLNIWREFKGNNYQELARKYKVSVQWVYQIVKRVQKEESAKRQTDMFETN